MCCNKLFVGDLINGMRSKTRGNYFACGTCPACQQARANRRAARIRNHHPQKFIAYFITLTYHNDYIPYVSKADITDIYNHLLARPDCDCAILPVYRDYDFKAKFKEAQKEKVDGAIDEVLVRLDRRLNYEELNKLSGLRTILSRHPTRDYIDPDKISVCYTPDIQNFIKRIRQNYFRENGERLQMSYYSAPEYGPTFGRFHIHLVMWFPSSFTETTVFGMCKKAWPYEDMYDKTFCQVARSPSHYLASYVNCDSSVSLFLRLWFPLRPSHSLEFGFDSRDFQLHQIIGHEFGDRRFKYTYLAKTSDGTYVSRDAFYPAYVLYRYFPKLKGFNRLSRNALLGVYTNPYKYLVLNTTPVAKAPNGEPLYRSNIKDFNGNFMLYTEKEATSFLVRLFKTYCRYYIPLDINWYDYAEIVIDYLIRRPLELYKDSQSDDSPTLTTRRFFNLKDIANGTVRNFTIVQHIRGDIPEVYNCNTLPEEVNSTNILTQQFFNNVKQRKLGDCT